MNRARSLLRHLFFLPEIRVDAISCPGYVNEESPQPYLFQVTSRPILPFSSRSTEGCTYACYLPENLCCLIDVPLLQEKGPKGVLSGHHPAPRFVVHEADVQPVVSGEFWGFGDLWIKSRARPMFPIHVFGGYSDRAFKTRARPMK